jgi:hypothetical protein
LMARRWMLSTEPTQKQSKVPLQSICMPRHKKAKRAKENVFALNVGVGTYYSTL